MLNMKPDLGPKYNSLDGFTNRSAVPSPLHYHRDEQSQQDGGSHEADISAVGKPRIIVSDNSLEMRSPSSSTISTVGAGDGRSSGSDMSLRDRFFVSADIEKKRVGEKVDRVFHVLKLIAKATAKNDQDIIVIKDCLSAMNQKMIRSEQIATSPQQIRQIVNSELLSLTAHFDHFKAQVDMLGDLLDKIGTFAAQITTTEGRDTILDQHIDDMHYNIAKFDRRWEGMHCIVAKFDKYFDGIHFDIAKFEKVLCKTEALIETIVEELGFVEERSSTSAHKMDNIETQVTNTSSEISTLVSSFKSLDAKMDRLTTINEAHPIVSDHSAIEARIQALEDELQAQSALHSRLGAMEQRVQVAGSRTTRSSSFGSRLLAIEAAIAERGSTPLSIGASARTFNESPSRGSAGGGRSSLDVPSAETANASYGPHTGLWTSTSRQSPYRRG